MVEPCCKDCPARRTACHDTCPKYKEEYKRQVDAERTYTNAMTQRASVYHRTHEDKHRERGRKRFFGANGGADK